MPVTTRALAGRQTCSGQTSDASPMSRGQGRLSPHSLPVCLQDADTLWHAGSLQSAGLQSTPSTPTASPPCRQRPCSLPAGLPPKTPVNPRTPWALLDPEALAHKPQVPHSTHRSATDLALGPAVRMVLYRNGTVQGLLPGSQHHYGLTIALVTALSPGQDSAVTLSSQDAPCKSETLSLVLMHPALT